MTNFEQYLSIPYRILGNSRRGADCWGLTRLILKEQFNIILPKQTELVKETIRTGKVDNENLWSVGCNDIKCVDVGNIVRLKEIRMMSDGHEELVDTHIGLVIEKNRVIHTSIRTGVVVDKLNHGEFSWRFVRGYRYEG